MGSAAQGDAEGPKGSTVSWLGLEKPLPPEQGLLRGHAGPVPGPPAMGGFTNPPQASLVAPRDILHALNVSPPARTHHPSSLVIARIPGHLGRTVRALGLINLDFKA